MVKSSIEKRPAKSKACQIKFVHRSRENVLIDDKHRRTKAMVRFIKRELSQRGVMPRRHFPGTVDRLEYQRLVESLRPPPTDGVDSEDWMLTFVWRLKIFEERLSGGCAGAALGSASSYPENCYDPNIRELEFFRRFHDASPQFCWFVLRCKQSVCNAFRDFDRTSIELYERCSRMETRETIVDMLLQVFLVRVVYLHIREYERHARKLGVHTIVLSDVGGPRFLQTMQKSFLQGKKPYEPYGYGNERHWVCVREKAIPGILTLLSNYTGDKGKLLPAGDELYKALSAATGIKEGTAAFASYQIGVDLYSFGLLKSGTHEIIGSGCRLTEAQLLDMRDRLRQSREVAELNRFKIPITFDVSEFWDCEFRKYDKKRCTLNAGRHPTMDDITRYNATLGNFYYNDFRRIYVEKALAWRENFQQLRQKKSAESVAGSQ